MERCVIHIREGGETKGPFTKFIKNKCGENQSWEKILHSIHRWKSITSRNKKFQEVSLKLIEDFSLYPVYSYHNLLQKCPSEDSNHAYHRDCYQNLTNISNIKKAEKSHEASLERKAKLIQMNKRGEYINFRYYLNIY